MLPKLSDKCGAKLQLVVPITLRRTNSIVRRKALFELKKVDSIQVSYVGKGNYAVEVLVDSLREGLPSNESTGSEGSEEQDECCSQPPAVRTERELSEFKTLRDKVHDAVHEAHNGTRCGFCTDILKWSVFGMNPDGVFLPLLGGERVARKLSKYMTDLLVSTVKHSSVDARGVCSGQTLVPQMVYEFLFTPPATDAA